MFSIVQGERCGRVSMALASESPTKSSQSGFQRSFRPSIIAMLPMWAIVIVRWPISAGAYVGCRDLHAVVEVAVLAPFDPSPAASISLGR